jgi:hypothetical protein
MINNKLWKSINAMVGNEPSGDIMAAYVAMKIDAKAINDKIEQFNAILKDRITGNSLLDGGYLATKETLQRSGIDKSLLSPDEIARATVKTPYTVLKVTKV